MKIYLDNAATTPLNQETKDYIISIIIHPVLIRKEEIFETRLTKQEKILLILFMQMKVIFYLLLEDQLLIR